MSTVALSLMGLVLLGMQTGKCSWWDALTLVSQAAGSYLHELICSFFSSAFFFFPRGEFSCRTSLVREQDAEKYLICPYFNIIFYLRNKQNGFKRDSNPRNSLHSVDYIQ